MAVHSAPTTSPRTSSTTCILQFTCGITTIRHDFFIHGTNAKQQDDDEIHSILLVHMILLFCPLQRRRHLLRWILRRVDLAVALIATSQILQQLVTQNIYLKHHIRLDTRDLQLRGELLSISTSCRVALFTRGPNRVLLRCCSSSRL